MFDCSGTRVAPELSKNAFLNQMPGTSKIHIPSHHITSITL